MGIYILSVHKKKPTVFWLNLFFNFSKKNENKNEKNNNRGLMYSTIKVRERHSRPHHEGSTVFERR